MKSHRKKEKNMTPENTGRILKNRDRDLGCQTIFIRRTICSRRSGRQTRLPDATVGIVHAGTEKNRHLLPEENRGEDYIIVYSAYDLTEGKDPKGHHTILADIVEPFPGRTAWRVVRSKHWEEYGFTQALAVRTEPVKCGC